MKIQLLLVALFIPFIAFAQYPDGTPTVGLKAYYSFDNCDATDDTGNGSDGELFGGLFDCDCGVSGSALIFNGVDNYVTFSGTTDLVNTYFDDGDITVSFYYKDYGNSPRTSLVSKSAACNDNLGLEIRLETGQNRLVTALEENIAFKEELTSDLDAEHCWHHVVLTRRDRLIRVYLDGQIQDGQFSEAISNSVLDITNTAPLSISNSPCIGTDGTSRFRGLIDEMAVYDEALTALQIEAMYLHPDEIGTRDTILFEGNSIQTWLTPTCATSFNWSPTVGVSDPTIANPILAPEVTTTYTLDMTDDLGCTTRDTVFIDVIDPDDLDCDNIFMPKAFTPNGDGLNDQYGISNPLAIFEFQSFDIYSRWGGRVFSADTQFDQWDGTNNGSELNAGIYVYQLRYNCNGERRNKSGSITLIK